MKRMRILHSTEYHYNTPVTFGPHTALIRPREGHDLHIESSRLVIEPEATVRWIRDIYGNAIAFIDFKEPAKVLKVVSDLEVNHYEELPIDYLIDPAAQSYPFQYSAQEQIEIIPFRLPSYPHDGPTIQRWTSDLYKPGQIINTAELLTRLQTRIFESFKYIPRDEPGVQLPCQTLKLQSGSCRDFAVFMMEAARHFGFAARFVTGYVQMAEGQHGSTHAWTEVYIPGAGWRGYDPTNNKPAESEHIAVAVAREHDKAMPLSGYWEGPGDAFERLEVSVQVVEIQ